jgi:hypothetical protein
MYYMRNTRTDYLFKYVKALVSLKSCLCAGMILSSFTLASPILVLKKIHVENIRKMSVLVFI